MRKKRSKTPPPITVNLPGLPPFIMWEENGIVKQFGLPILAETVETFSGSNRGNEAAAFIRGVALLQQLSRTNPEPSHKPATLEKGMWVHAPSPDDNEGDMHHASFVGQITDIGNGRAVVTDPEKNRFEFDTKRLQKVG